jgi:hypothetical protein
MDSRTTQWTTGGAAIGTIPGISIVYWLGELLVHFTGYAGPTMPAEVAAILAAVLSGGVGWLLAPCERRMFPGRESEDPAPHLEPQQEILS